LAGLLDVVVQLGHALVRCRGSPLSSTVRSERIIYRLRDACVRPPPDPRTDGRAMAANLTPQYLEAEAEDKKAQTAEERLACLKKMYSLLPKHKASEKLQADLKTKISETREEVERERRSPKKVGVSHKIPKQGAGQYVIVGAPNAGKSRLLTRLTRAAPEVA